MRENDLINGAMTLAALILMLFFPFIITLAAVSPLRPGGAAEVIVRRMGLNHDAAMAVERLFTPDGGGGGSAQSGWTVLGVVWLTLGGLSLAGAVQSVYLRVFRIPAFGLRGVPAQVVWLAGLIVFLAGTTATGAVLTGTIVGQVCQGLIVVAAMGLLFWIGTRILVRGRLGWREILPAAVFTTIGLTGLGVVSRLLFSASIVENERNYGEIGVVFTLLSWLIGIGVVLTGGATVGGWYNEQGLSVLRAFRRRASSSSE
ncbi:ribonuclease BN [Frankia gtarii]|uniref:ribonuclease BN n=1 Tax=Frankia gtarii TaxID=2950102 RepID=UPI0021BEFA2E|nr:ribonuclease BN [Frankia gtarii]